LEINGPASSILGFDGTAPWKAGGTPDQYDLDLLETLIFDSAERFLLTNSEGTGFRLLGTRFRLDGGTDEDYSGPFYDIYQGIDHLDFESETRRRPKKFYVNSDTMTLDLVKYQIERSGSTFNVEIRFSNWSNANGQLVPALITRIENGQPVFTLSITGVSASAKADDGAFARP
jgi:hypothetical protein